MLNYNGFTELIVLKFRFRSFGFKVDGVTLWFNI